MDVWSQDWFIIPNRGVQYASNEFQALLKTNGIQCSMSRKGDCWDNAVAESFFRTLKVELIHIKTYNTGQEAKTAIFEHYERFYNRQRRHSYLGYLSPMTQVLSVRNKSVPLDTLLHARVLIDIWLIIFRPAI